MKSARMSQCSVFKQYLEALPRLGVDGSLATVKEFESNPTLAGAKGRVRAKTGTLVSGESEQSGCKRPGVRRLYPCEEWKKTRIRAPCE